MKESDIRNQMVLDQYLAMVEADVKKLFDKEKFENIPCPICGGEVVRMNLRRAGLSM